MLKRLILPLPNLYRFCIFATELTRPIVAKKFISGTLRPDAGLLFIFKRNCWLTRVAPGNAISSLLYQQVLDGSMPKTGSLNTSQINAIKTWINSGAPNN